MVRTNREGRVRQSRLIQRAARLRQKVGCVLALCASIGVSMMAASCGGGGTGSAAAEMRLVEFLIVDRALNPAASTGSLSVPRNAQFLMVFSEIVDPATVDQQTIQVRTGPAFQSVPTGSFSVSGRRVVWDPTVDVQGQPNPQGLPSIQQFSINIPSFEEQPGVVNNLDADPNLSAFFTNFTTSDGYLRELVPPEFVGFYFIPEPDPLTGQIPGNGVLALEFSEAMDPATFIQSLGPEPTAASGVDIRYLGGTPITPPPAVNAPVAGKSIPGTFTNDAAMKTFFFKPAFSFGDQNFVFNFSVFQALKDLAGNSLINPQSRGDFVCDGLGNATGSLLIQDFENTGPFKPDHDITAAPPADWGTGEAGTLQGVLTPPREQTIYGYFEADGNDDGTSNRGQYSATPDPLVGADLNQFVTPAVPTSEGRRVMLSFSHEDMGPRGSIVGAGWGPDFNRTFAALYQNIYLRAGYQANDSVTLSASFAANFKGDPALLYQGDYTVGSNADVGNKATPTYNGEPNVGGAPGCVFANSTTQFLFDWTGFYDWPAFTNFFEWDPAPSTSGADPVFIFDASVPEGSTFQAMRRWSATTFVCSGFQIPSYPLRRLMGIYEQDVVKPPEQFGVTRNPENSLADTLFTIRTVRSLARSKFYTPTLPLPGDPTFPNGVSGGSVSLGGTTFGTNSDYLTPQIVPPVQAGGAKVVIEYQGAQAVLADRTTIDAAFPFTDWTQNIDDCDGYACIRWRATLIANIVSEVVPQVTSITIPVQSSGP